MTDAGEALRWFLRGHDDLYPRVLAERFPKLLQRLAENWLDKAAMEELFAELMISDRYDRQGFPPEIATEIMLLNLSYDRIRHLNDERPTDLWEAERAVAELDRLHIEPTTANFVRAAEAGDHALCLLFVSSGFNVDSRDSRHWTPLMVASFNGREALALQLIEHGADIHAQDNRGYTPMHWAAFNGFTRVIEVLVRKRGNVDARSVAGITPLLQAAARGHLETCTELLNAGANPNLAAGDGATPLLKAVANAHLSVINLLLSVGARLDASLENGKSLREIAMSSRDSGVRQRIANAIQNSPAEKSARDRTSD